MKKTVALTGLIGIVAASGFLFWKSRYGDSMPIEKNIDRVEENSAAARTQDMKGTLSPGSSTPAPAVTGPRSAMGARPGPEDIAKLDSLNQILDSKNDNDPRLDSAFNNLTPGAKSLFRDRYLTLPKEKLNERGTIVFLLGRNITTPDDIAFLASVASDTPCRSFEACDKEGPRGNEDPHREAGADVTLAYPQIVALKSIENYLSSGKRSPEMTEAARKTLLQAKSSPAPIVSRMAEGLLQRFARG